MASFSSQKSSFQYLYDAPLQGRFTTLDDYFTSHVCGFCATSLGVRSGSRPAHQVTGQGFPAGTSGATQNHAQVGSSSGFIIINETAVYISKWGWWGILGWRHSPKMADAQMFVPVSIGFGKTALVPARFEYSAWQMCVRERKHSTSTCGISTSRIWLPGEESATDAGPWMDHGTGDCSLESDGTGANVMSRSTTEALHPGSGFLEVFWSFPELVPARHGMCCWGHVDIGSSGGRTTRRGCRTSSPTSIAYTIGMQPLLRRS